MRYGSIPRELCLRPQWVLSGADKRPLSVMGMAASVTDRTTWTTFCKARQHSRIGFVFTTADPFVGIDLDKCMEAGRPCAEARVILKHLRSYTERSPSGTGLHIIGYGKLPACRRTAPKGFAQLEAYDRARYFTMTGEHYPGTPRELMELELGWLWRRYFDERPRVSARASPVNGDDEHLLAVAMRDPDFVRFWTGYRGGDWSRADFALMCHLAGLTGGDAERMERLFSESGLAKRDKWRHRPDYRARTVASAIQATHHGR